MVRSPAGQKDELPGRTTKHTLPDMFIRLQADPVSDAAAEFRDAKGESIVVRFEKNTNAEAMVVRIDGAEAYCRRLKP